MNRLTIPAILVATVMVAGIFAFMPVQQASTVHTSGTITLASDADIAAILVDTGTTLPALRTGVACVTEDVAALATADNDIITYTFSQPVKLLSVFVNADASLAGDTLDFDAVSVNGGANVYVGAGTAATDAVSVSYAIEQELLGIGIQNTVALTINSIGLDAADNVSITFCVSTLDPANFDATDITTAITAV